MKSTLLSQNETTYMERLAMSELFTVFEQLLTAILRQGDIQPDVRYFEGKPGIIALQEEFLKVKDKEILGIFSVDAALNALADVMGSYSARRLAQGIRGKGIYTSESGPILRVTDPALLRESKYIPPVKFPFTHDITLFGDSIAIVSFDERMTAFVITHAGAARTFRMIFSQLWETLPDEYFENDTET